MVRLFLLPDASLDRPNFYLLATASICETATGHSKDAAMPNGLVGGLPFDTMSATIKEYMAILMATTRIPVQNDVDRIFAAIKNAKVSSDRCASSLD